MPTTRRGVVKDALGAVYDLLAVSTLTTLATGGVHHGQPPANELRDHVILQAPTGEAWNAMQSPGEDVFFQVAGVTLSPDYGPALAMLTVVIQLLDGERPTVSNHLCVALQYQRTQVFQEPDLVNNVPTWRAVAVFRMLWDQTS